MTPMENFISVVVAYFAILGATEYIKRRWRK
jgi:hypothetical protein